MNYVAGKTLATGIQWILDFPAGTIVKWQATKGSALTCNTTGGCSLTGNPVTGVVAVALVDFPSGQFAMTMRSVFISAPSVAPVAGSPTALLLALPDTPLTVTTSY